MTLRIIFCAVIVCGCTYVGIILSRNFGVRVNQLNSFIKALCELEFNILFLHIPISEAFSLAADGRDGAVKRIFQHAAQTMKKRPGENAGGAVRGAVSAFKSKLSLTEDDVQILLDFSDNLGKGAADEERNNIKMAVLKLRSAAQEASDEQAKNERLYKGLGLLTGCLIAIILF